MIHFSSNIKCFGPAETNRKDTAGRLFLPKIYINNRILPLARSVLTLFPKQQTGLMKGCHCKRLRQWP